MQVLQKKPQKLKTHKKSGLVDALTSIFMNRTPEYILKLHIKDLTLTRILIFIAI